MNPPRKDGGHLLCGTRTLRFLKGTFISAITFQMHT